MTSPSNILDDLERLVKDLRRRKKSPHCYVKQEAPKLVPPDLTRMAFDAERFRWLVSNPSNVRELALAMDVRASTDPIQSWRDWVDLRMPNGPPS